jgi:hypothetical protein
VSYRDDLEAALARADSAERERRRIEIDSHQKITALSTQLAQTEKQLATASAAGPLVTKQPRKKILERTRRKLLALSSFAAGVGVSVFGHVQVLLAGTGVTILLVMIWATVGAGDEYRELLDEFFRSLRGGDYEEAYGRLHKIAQSPEAFSRFCERIEALHLALGSRLVHIAHDRWLRADARVITGTIRCTGGELPLEATIASDAQGAWRIQDVSVGQARLRHEDRE